MSLGILAGSARNCSDLTAACSVALASPSLLSGHVAVTVNSLHGKLGLNKALWCSQKLTISGMWSHRKLAANADRAEHASTGAGIRSHKNMEEAN